MPRNLIERCEVVFPVPATGAAEAAARGDSGGLSGGQHQGATAAAGWGVCACASRSEQSFSAQDYLMQVAEGKEAKVPVAAKHDKVSSHRIISRGALALCG